MVRRGSHGSSCSICGCPQTYASYSGCVRDSATGPCAKVLIDGVEPITAILGRISRGRSTEEPGLCLEHCQITPGERARLQAREGISHAAAFMIFTAELIAAAAIFDTIVLQRVARSQICAMFRCSIIQCLPAHKCHMGCRRL